MIDLSYWKIWLNYNHFSPTYSADGEDGYWVPCYVITTLTLKEVKYE